MMPRKEASIYSKEWAVKKKKKEWAVQLPGMFESNQTALPASHIQLGLWWCV